MNRTCPSLQWQPTKQLIYLKQGLWDLWWIFHLQWFLSILNIIFQLSSSKCNIYIFRENDSKENKNNLPRTRRTDHPSCILFNRFEFISSILKPFSGPLRSIHLKVLTIIITREYCSFKLKKCVSNNFGLILWYIKRFTRSKSAIQEKVNGRGLEEFTSY